MAVMLFVGKNKLNYQEYGYWKRDCCGTSAKKGNIPKKQTYASPAITIAGEA